MFAAPQPIAMPSPERLTQALRRCGCLVDGHVTEVVAEPIGKEVGFLDSLARLTLTYDRPQATAPKSLVIKVSSTESTYKQIGEMYDAYEREFHFYDVVAPDAPIRLPRCFAREVDPATKAHILLLEDLGALMPGNEVAGLAPDQAATTVETIGRFHAHWWESPRLDALTWMPRRNLRPARYQAMWSKFREVVGPRLSATALALGEHLNVHLETLLDKADRAPQTIVHSDFRADNLLFDPTSSRDPVVVLDWQLAIRGKGMLDIARLLCESLNPPDRAAHEMNLLQQWHEALLRGGVRDYAFDQVVADYRTCVLICLYYPVTIHEAEEAAGARGTALAHAQIDRFFAAAETHCGDLLRRQ